MTPVLQHICIPRQATVHLGHGGVQRGLRASHRREDATAASLMARQ